MLPEEVLLVAVAVGFAVAVAVGFAVAVAVGFAVAVAVGFTVALGAAVAVVVGLAVLTLALQAADSFWMSALSCSFTLIPLVAHVVLPIDFKVSNLLVRSLRVAKLVELVVFAAPQVLVVVAANAWVIIVMVTNKVAARVASIILFVLFIVPSFHFESATLLRSSHDVIPSKWNVGRILYRKIEIQRFG